MQYAFGPKAAASVLMFVMGSVGGLAGQTGTSLPAVPFRDPGLISDDLDDLRRAKLWFPPYHGQVADFQLDEQPRGSWGRAFLVEAVGGSIGSAAGLGLGFVVTNPGGCPIEDLGCTIRQVGGGIAFSAVGAATGTVLAGRAASTGPSLLGAAIGAIAGIPAGLGLVHLLSEDIDLVHADAPLFITYAVTHGIVTAIGSRIGAALRN